MIPLASETSKLHNKKSINKSGKKKNLKYLHLPNEDSMDKGDNNIIADTNNNNTSVSDNTQQISDNNTIHAAIDSNLDFFENRHLERVLLTNNLTTQNHVNARSDSIGGRDNNHTTKVSKQTIHKPSYSQNTTISRMQYQDFENSSNPFSLHEGSSLPVDIRNAMKTNNNSVLTVNSNNAKLTKNVTLGSMITDTKGVVDVDDLETVNSNEKPFILPSTSLQSQPQKTIQHHTNNNKPSAVSTSRHLGDRNDWGNSSPAVDSENKHYWDKKKKTKANINNVNHKMKDFSSIFFISAMKHDVLSEDDVATPVPPTPLLGKDKLLEKSPQLSINNNTVTSELTRETHGDNRTSELSHGTSNSTLLQHNTSDNTVSSPLGDTNTTSTSTGHQFSNNTNIAATTALSSASNDNKTTAIQHQGSVNEGVAKSLHVSNVTFTGGLGPSATTSSPDKQQDGSSVVVVVERQPVSLAKEEKIINNTGSENTVKISDVEEASLLPSSLLSNENKTQQGLNQTDFTEHLLKQLQSLSSKKHFLDRNNTTTTTASETAPESPMAVVKPKQQTFVGTETAAKDGKPKDGIFKFIVFHLIFSKTLFFKIY